MNKAELIHTLAESSGQTKAASEAVLNAFIGTVQKTLAAGEPVALVGFGTFAAINRDARTGRNPQTGEAIDIPAKRVVKFKAGSTLADAVNA